MANFVVDEMMPQALKEAKKFEEKSGGIKSKYFGGISSFGTSIISTGIKPTLLLYSAKSEKFPEYENSILNILNSYLSKDNIDNLYYYENTDILLDAVIALKLAIRTYNKEINEGGNNE